MSDTELDILSPCFKAFALCHFPYIPAPCLLHAELQLYAVQRWKRYIVFLKGEGLCYSCERLNERNATKTELIRRDAGKCNVDNPYTDSCDLQLRQKPTLWCQSCWLKITVIKPTNRVISKNKLMSELRQGECTTSYRDGSRDETLL